MAGDQLMGGVTVVVLEPLNVLRCSMTGSRVSGLSIDSSEETISW